MMILDWLIDILINLSYGAIVIAILAGSFGIPIPEEIVLLIVGYLAGIEFFELKYVLIVCFFSMLLGDNISYFLGYTGSKIVNWVLRTTRTAWLREHLERHPCKTIFLSRFLSGLRVFFPIAAGSVRMPWKKFFVADLLAVAVLVPVFVLLGFYLKPHFDAVIAWVLRVDKIVLVVFGVIVVVSFLGIGFLERFLFKKK